MQIKIENLNNIKKEKHILNFVNILKNIKGKKIVTIAVKGENREFYIDGDFNFLDIIAEYLFYTMLEKGVPEHAGIIVRQFLNIKIKRKINGKEVWIPQKKIYGFFAKSNNIFPLSKEEVELCCNTDAKTGLPLEPEEDVVFASI
jgi:hypothetical protein